MQETRGNRVSCAPWSWPHNGSSDDDPSGIATYTQAGAEFSYAITWTLRRGNAFSANAINIGADLGAICLKMAHTRVICIFWHGNGRENSMGRLPRRPKTRTRKLSENLWWRHRGKAAMQSTAFA